MTGTLLGIFVADEAGAPMRQLQHTWTLKGQGLNEDRYSRQAGTWSRVRPGQVPKIRHVSLIQVEALEAANGELEQPFTCADTRRNLLTKGISLNELVGREFMVGEVRLRGVELCIPCSRPSQLCGKPGFAKAFQGRGGLRAEVLTIGQIMTDDQIVVL